MRDTLTTGFTDDAWLAERDFGRLTVIIPAYNEAATITTVLKRLTTASLNDTLELEVLVVDDGSTDETAERVNAFASARQGVTLTLLQHELNRGKGAAIRTAVRQATGDYVLIQDADLEYNPADIHLLLEPVLMGGADAVFGSRFVSTRPRRIIYNRHAIGNRFLTALSNLLTDFNLSDIETCYKLIRTDLLQAMPLRENRFGFEPEVTARLSKIKGLRLYEVGISYYGRTFAEGKKIRWTDGVRAIYCILRYNLGK